MSKKSTPFFATKNDLAKLLSDLNMIRPIELVRSGIFAEGDFKTSVDISNMNGFASYLIVDAGVEINPRTVPASENKAMHAIDQINNPCAIFLQVGGVYSEKHLIAGQVGTVSGVKQSEELYTLLKNFIQKDFEKIKSYYVGKEAAAMLDDGSRLSPTPRSTQLYDLVR